MKRIALFDKVHIIESLKEDDLKSGRLLYEDLLSWQAGKYPDLSIAYEDISNAKEFLTSLFDVAKGAMRENRSPMLHIECHGNREGLQMKKGWSVSWDELRGYLIKINQACRNNLVITLAACDGIYLIKVAEKFDRAPFWALVAPVGKIPAAQVADGFYAFYKEFFRSLSGDAAILALNSVCSKELNQYAFYATEKLFLDAYRKYLSRYCRGKDRQKRIERLVTEARQNPSMTALPIRDVRNKIKSELRDKEKEHFERMRDKYFFIDLFPENRMRFPLKYEDAFNPRG